MTKCPKCKFYNICKGRINETVENCVRFKSTEQTNEEWLCNLSTEEKAKVLYKKAHENYMRGINGKLPIMSKDWEMWLKQSHREERRTMNLCDSCGKTNICPWSCSDGCTECKDYSKQTNEEWLRSCTTEQLAEWLRGIYWHCHEIDCKHCNYPWRCMEKGDIVEWLKQPHHESVTKCNE